MKTNKIILSISSVIGLISGLLGILTFISTTNGPIQLCGKDGGLAMGCAFISLMLFSIFLGALIFFTIALYKILKEKGYRRVGFWIMITLIAIIIIIPGLIFIAS